MSNKEAAEVLRQFLEFGRMKYANVMQFSPTGTKLVAALERAIEVLDPQPEPTEEKAA